MESFTAIICFCLFLIDVYVSTSLRMRSKA